MARYIDADAFIQKMQRVLDENNNTSVADTISREAFQIIIEGLKKTPAADVEEVKHGEWVEVTTNFIDDLAFDTVASMRCSKCERYHNEVYHYGNPTQMAHYCPFCGARMDGKEKTNEN